MRFTIIAALCLLTACQKAPEALPDNETATTVTPVDEVAACTKRGIQYYKDIQSYPTLKSAPNRGRLASEVAAEKCGRSTMAFGK